MFAASAHAGAHTWRVSELFSNASGTIQFIELKECCGLPGETFLAGYDVRSVATGNIVTIPANLVGNTANKHLLFGTAAFAALPGAPAVNYTIPAGFFSTGGDTIQYGQNPPAIVSDAFTFGPGVLPTNGKGSITVTNFVTHTFTVGPNSPTNFAGISGNVDACPADCDGSNDGVVAIADFLAVLSQWGTVGSCSQGQGTIGINQFLATLSAWGNCS
jgi:hypothetical protein